ncbi:predicted protein [Plenodomus lingam JN3]|uniref:Predicted protein n=1 Tax=Leptosphaeria maculans (strain JN3 / isolate v23.1.3 / race Av1-4-5-6-7-8) TaxID=985895 RepID=E4ZW84_LEPMJ|nr:predicted protein [Plenodomus lingam JN3]CBX95860.1 predicted protein [Plenodomus lingam JN3]
MFFGSGWGAGGSWFVLGVSELGLRWSVEVEGDDEGEVKLACSTPAYDAFGTGSGDTWTALLHRQSHSHSHSHSFLLPLLTTPHELTPAIQDTCLGGHIHAATSPDSPTEIGILGKIGIYFGEFGRCLLAMCTEGGTRSRFLELLKSNCKADFLSYGNFTAYLHYGI